MGRKKEDFCRKGHEFNEYTAYIKPNGTKNCRVCRYVREKRYKAKNNFGGNRELTIQRDNETCVGCGITRQEHRLKFSRDITVDHIESRGVFDSKSEVPNHNIDNLQTLCVSCHGKKDGKRSWMYKLNKVGV